MGIKEKRISKMTYIAVFALTTLVFIIGIMVGYFISEKKLTEIDDFQEDFKNKILALEVEYQLLSENPCQATQDATINDDLYDLASKLDFMENSLGKNDPQVIRMKDYYFILEIRQWLFDRKTKKECDTNSTMLLYFYAKDDDCIFCNEQGVIITNVRRNNENVRVYSFDVNSENKAVQSLKSIYAVNETPSLVVDDRLHSGFLTKDEIIEIIR